MSSHNRSLLTVKDFSKKHPAFSEGSLRWLIFNSKSNNINGEIQANNGLGKAILRCGRKALIDEDLFFQWLDSAQKTNQQ